MPYDAITDNFRARCIARMVQIRSGLGFAEAAKMFDAFPYSAHLNRWPIRMRDTSVLFVAQEMLRYGSMG